MSTKKILTLISYAVTLFILSLIISNCKTAASLSTVTTPVYPIKINDRWGLTDTMGRLYCAPKFAELKRFHSGLAAAQLNGKYGYIDTQGHWRIPPRYDQADNFTGDCALVVIDGQTKYINRKGKRKSAAQCGLPLIRESCIAAANFSTILDVEKFILKKEEKYAIKYEQIKDTTAFIYQSVKAFDRDFFIVEKGNKFGFFFRPIPRVYQGKTYIRDTVERYVYDEILVTPPKALPNDPKAYYRLAKFHRYRIGSSWGILDHNQQRITPPKYHSIQFLPEEDYFLVEFQPGQFGYLTKAGKEKFRNYHYQE